jgi:hypothetical protein
MSALPKELIDKAWQVLEDNPEGIRQDLFLKEIGKSNSSWSTITSLSTQIPIYDERRGAHIYIVLMEGAW